MTDGTSEADSPVAERRTADVVVVGAGGVRRHDVGGEAELLHELRDRASAGRERLGAAVEREAVELDAPDASADRVTVLEAAVRDVLARGAVAPAHVFNLGHGVPPETDPTVLTRVVELVHEAGA